MNPEKTSIYKSMLGSIIKNKRIEKGLTQQELAELIGVKPKSISFIERGINFPSFENIFCFAQILDFSIDEFIFGYSKFKDDDYINEIHQLINNLSEENKTIVFATIKTMCLMLNNEEHKKKEQKTSNE